MNYIIITVIKTEVQTLECITVEQQKLKRIIIKAKLQPQQGELRNSLLQIRIQLLEGSISVQ